ncbi:MAG: hypothetical protein JST26_09275 [Bacteroidetes bacterium]|nr:hypothetical protein [Bacteroidota bacterium]
MKSFSIHQRIYILAGICLLFMLLPQISEAQCAMCKAAVESNVKSDPNSVAKGINKGILYLMAVPYLLLMFIFRKQIATVWRKLRKKDVTVSEK